MTNEKPQLSEREIEILEHVAKGSTNQQIAYDLDISVHTVKVHLRNIFGKIGVSSRTEATVHAMQHGLVQVEHFAPSSPPSTRSGNEGTPPELVPEQPVEGTPPEPEPVEGTPPEPEQSVEGTPPEPEQLVEGVEDTSPTQKPELQASSEVTIYPNTTILNVSPSEQRALPTPQRERVQSRPAAATVITPNKPRPVPSNRHMHWLVGTLVAVIVVLGIALTYAMNQPSPAPSQAATNVSLTAASPIPTSRWKTLSAMATLRNYFAVASYEYDGKLYVIGGENDTGPVATVERYDPENDVWVLLNDKPTAVSQVHATTIGGIIYVPGGVGEKGTPLAVFESYDPRNQKWHSLSDLPEPRSHYALASFEGNLYLFGGWDGHTYCDDVFIYDPAEESWSEGEPLPTPRRNAGVAVAEGRMYVIGGEDEDGGLQVNERYDPTSTQWQTVAPIPEPIGNPAVEGITSMVFVLDPQQQKAFQYKPSNDAWDSLDMPDTVAISSRISHIVPNLFVFGTAEDDTPSVVSEYRVFYTTFLPHVTSP